MNRHQRRALAARGKGLANLRTAADGLIKSVAPGQADPSRRYLCLNLRPMTAADMIPGYAYAPGLSLLEITEPAPPGGTAFILHIPIELPPELREPTPSNAKTAYAIAYSTDPEAKKLIDEMLARVRPWNEIQASRGNYRTGFGPIVYPPSDPPAPFPSGEISPSRH